MYKIIGGDQKEYGPATAEEMRRWIQEGRLSGQSLVLAEGSTEWKPLATFAEFAEALRAQVVRTPADQPMSLLSAEAWSAQILARQPEVRIGACLARSWDLLMTNFGLIFGATALIWLISLIQFIPALGILYLLLEGVFFGGLYLVVLKRIRGKPASASEVFAGFGPAFAQLMLAGFLSYLLASLGFLFCVLPGVYLFVAWTFSVPLVADKRLEFWSAMELSRKVVSRVWFPMLGLLLLAYTPFILTFLAVEVRIFMAVFPAIMSMMSSVGHGQPDVARLMEILKEVTVSAFPLLLLARFVLLLNLPLAVGAVMYAYEDLFGTRPSPRP